MQERGGFYYLHTNGDLIFKPRSVVDADPAYFDSDFVRRVWPIDTTDRATAWRLLLEAAACEAKPERLRELAQRWGCDARDLPNYLTRSTDLAEPTPERMRGLLVFFGLWGIDAEAWFDALAKGGPEAAEKIRAGDVIRDERDEGGR